MNSGRLQISAERRKQFESASDDLLDHALSVHDNFHASKKQATVSERWKLVRRKKSLNLYRERRKTKQERTLLCSGVVYGTVEDMISGTNANTSDSMRISLSIITDKSMDAKVVHVFEDNPVTSSVIFSGIKWMALRMPTVGSMIHDRDILSYHRIGRIVDTRGQFYVYGTMQSVDLPEMPANQQRNIERARVSLTYLFRQVQEEWVGCFILGETLMGGSMPRSMGELMGAEQMLSVGQFLRVANAKAYSTLMAKSAERMSSTSSWCDVCMKKPGMLDGSLKFCMGCRRNACKKCRERCTVFRLAPRTHRPETEVFCSQCIAEVTKPTTSTFYMSSLNESTNQVHKHLNASVSTITKDNTSGRGFASSSPSSSSKSQDFAELPDGWFAGPEDSNGSENLGGLANFVERASFADSRGQQWNQQELDYLSGMLRESGHYRAPECVTRRTRSSHEYCPGSSQTSHERPERRAARSHASLEGSSRCRAKYLNVDELD